MKIRRIKIGINVAEARYLEELLEDDLETTDLNQQERNNAKSLLHRVRNIRKELEG